MNASLTSAQAGKSNIINTTEKIGGCMEEQGYSPLFYVMLLLGIMGVVGFFTVAASAAGGM